MIREPAAAKVNLALHVTGRGPGGLHDLDSLVAFATIGDVVRVSTDRCAPLSIEGPFAGALAAEGDNLVNRAAASILEAAAPDRTAPIALNLEKNLPVASGLGGGSADAAATLRAVNTALKLGLDRAALERLAGGLGADVPMCVGSRAARVTGIGDRIAPLPNLPPLPCVLVNPGAAVSTPDVFGALEHRTNPPIPPDLVLGETAPEIIAALAALRNDLEAPARALAPAIGHVLAALREISSCRLARMSGSGATCFGLFETEEAAERAAQILRADNPQWWIAPCRLEDNPFAAGA